VIARDDDVVARNRAAELVRVVVVLLQSGRVPKIHMPRLTAPWVTHRSPFAAAMSQSASPSQMPGPSSTVPSRSTFTRSEARISSNMRPRGHMRKRSGSPGMRAQIVWLTMSLMA
jgi:hypothetical protein